MKESSTDLVIIIEYRDGMQLHENLQVDVFSTVVPVDANSSHLCARNVLLFL